MGDFVRKACLCCECKYWSEYIINHTELGLGILTWGRCLKNKSAFPDMPKCENFEKKTDQN